MEQALIGLIGIIIGILLSKLLERLLDVRKRHEQQIDMVYALHAEIAAGDSAAGDQTQDAERDYLVENDWPVGPADRTDFVFSSIKTNISVLPQNVIHSVIRYYRLAEQSNLLVDDLKHVLYERQSREERRKYSENIILSLRDQSAAAKEAPQALEDHLIRHETQPPKRVRAASDEGANRSNHLDTLVRNI